MGRAWCVIDTERRPGCCVGKWESGTLWFGRGRQGSDRTGL